ncbi:MAG: hypothetical protein WAW52_01185 [Methanothrix sp.]
MNKVTECKTCDPCSVQEYSEQDLPTIMADDRRLQDITSEALQSLQENNNTVEIFQRGGFICRLKEKEPGKLVIENVNDSILRGILSRRAEYKRTQSKRLIPPPSPVIKDILALGKWAFPFLAGIVSCPVLREDGSLLSLPGYDEASGLYYNVSKGLEIPKIPDHPTQKQAIRACKYIMNNVFVDFPFEDQASRANALAGLLSPIVRPMVKGCIPMMLIDKPSPGTGASLILEVMSIIAIGQVAEMKSPVGSEDEWRKMITSALREGPALILIDNIVARLKSPSLARALTSSQWSDRRLGKSEDLSLPQRACWYANGNRLALSGDLPRRCYLVRMDAQLAEPWKRDPSKFKHPNIRGWAEENRGKLLAALLTMARAWVESGRPVGTDKVIGGFTEWVETLGGILNHAGVSGFLDNLDELYQEADEVNEQWQRFFEIWYSIFGDKIIPANEIVAELEKHDSDLSIEAPEKMAKAMRGIEQGRAIRVGLALRKKNKVRYTNGYMLIKHFDRGKKQKLWQVKKIKVAAGG